MIAQLNGTVLAAGPTWIVIDIQGVGFHAWTNPATAASARIGEKMVLYTSLVVREDSLSLYGFSEALEKEAFELVQQASGVGPKLAAAMLSVLSPAQIQQAISSEDIATLTTVPGIGRKGAQKIMIELKDKVATLGATDTAAVVTPTQDGWRIQVSDALTSLGWSAKDADKALAEVAPLAQENPDISIGVLLKHALASLAKR